jgi:hypothetical protein
VDLLEAVSHVVQILGSQRLLTLSHREQAKRFAGDLLRVLKNQKEKRIRLNEYASAYETLMQTPFDVSSYGVCYIEDILQDVWEGTVLISYEKDGEKVVEIPQRVRTEDEVKRTIVFGQEVVQLLSQTPTLSMPFSKFIPSYHQHFCRQCRVLDYGFTKLIELFEAITPKTIEMRITHDNEKLILLSKHFKAKVLAMRLASIQLNRKSISYSQIHDLYRQKFGHTMSFDDFNLEELMLISKTVPKDSMFSKLLVQKQHHKKHFSNSKTASGIVYAVPLPPPNWTESKISTIDNNKHIGQSHSGNAAATRKPVNNNNSKRLSPRMATNFGPTVEVV